MYNEKPIPYDFYWEDVDRDTFIGVARNYISFQALDSTDSLDYEWQIGKENIKHQRTVFRDFSDVTSSQSISITLMVHYKDGRSDTITRSFYLLINEYKNYMLNVKYLFINDKNYKDTIRYEYRRPNGTVLLDSFFVNNCVKRIDEKIINIYELAFTVNNRSSAGVDCFAIGEGFLKLDNLNIQKAYLYLKMSRDKLNWTYDHYTGYRIN